VTLHQKFQHTRQISYEVYSNSLISNEISEVTSGMQKDSLQMARSKAFGE